MGSVKSAGLTSVHPSRAPAWRGPTVLKSPLMMWPCPATSSAFRSSSPSRRSPNTLMGRWLKLRLKTRPRFLPVWSLNFRKRSTPSPRISVRHSPITERRSAKTWGRGHPVFTPSRSPAARRGSSTNGRFCSLENPFQPKRLKLTPQESDSLRSASPSNSSVSIARIRHLAYMGRVELADLARGHAQVLERDVREVEVGQRVVARRPRRRGRAQTLQAFPAPPAFCLQLVVERPLTAARPIVCDIHRSSPF